ncbi:cyclase family protein [Amycolatopsis sp. GM8]|uniref:cyclase family protein n=1 Tax=Amycolatopsis sp. GM8 TaxID=2896530 RepID=UPI001F238921|nr:cyclase family protein [Amycolatopsis sp. GM8]
MKNIPSYADLLRRQDAPPGSSWHVYGDNDQLGMLNNVTPAAARRAASLVRTGETFDLDYPVNRFVPSLSGTRGTAVHHIFANNAHHRDDWLDSFFLQSSSQIDGLRHFRHPVHGFYGGVVDQEVAEGTPHLGIQAASERAVVSRAVLVDLPAYFAAAGVEYDVATNHAVSADDLDNATRHQEVAVEPGDILLLYTGWAEHYLSLSEQERERSRGTCPGLMQSHAVLEWLWDHRIGLIAADNISVEAYPVHPDSAFFLPEEQPPVTGADHRGLMHRPLLALLGLMLGELWRLEPLARACRVDGVYELMVSVKPLNLVGGVGSPANAIAVR